MSDRLGELLVRENLITVQALREAQEEQQRSGVGIGTALIVTGAIEESTLTDFLSKQYGVPAINLKGIDIDPEIIKRVPKEIAEKYGVIPVNRAGSSLIVAMCDPSDISTVNALKSLTGCTIESRVASELSIREAIERYYAEQGPSLDDIDDDAPVAKLVNLILLDAINKDASDIHVEADEKGFRVCFRIDGSLHEMMRPPMKLRDAITRRLKLMAEMDIFEHRLPQDGLIQLRIGGGKEVAFRVSVRPTPFGEKVVMQLTEPSSFVLQ